MRLAQLGRRLEAHFGCPQDIEWCLVDEDFHIVQSRPITTLFPIPAANDRENHVYVSVGHQQMMTDPMKPLGLCVWQLTTPRPMAEAGGRLFVDVTRGLASPASRAGLLNALGKRSDPLLGDALQSIIDRGDFIPSLPDEAPGGAPAGGAPAPLETDPAIVAELIGRSQASIAALKRDIRTKSGSALLDFIVADLQARVILDMSEAHLEAGDILVTPYTDPSWTPLFVAIKGLVTEVGGLMTHGAVIAREYGLPAVVGVEHATRRIRDGQRIRVHGTDGYVELLPVA